jgi:hypothetical protein
MKCANRKYRVWLIFTCMYTCVAITHMVIQNIPSHALSESKTQPLPRGNHHYHQFVSPILEFHIKSDTD